jgi:hypothetical protein
MVCCQTKIPNLGKFLECLGMKKVGTLGIYYGYLVICWQFGVFSPVLVHKIKKNLAILASTTSEQSYGRQVCSSDPLMKMGSLKLKVKLEPIRVPGKE